MTGLDTSIVVRLLVGEPEDLAKRARKFLDELFDSGEQAAVSDLVVSETYFALHYHYNVPKADALKALRAMFDSGEIKGTGAAPEVLKTRNLASANPGFVDRMIHRGYLDGGAGMATFEKKSRRLENVKVLSPG